MKTKLKTIIKRLGWWRFLYYTLASPVVIVGAMSFYAGVYILAISFFLVGRFGEFKRTIRKKI
jgi:hypothetical protein